MMNNPKVSCLPPRSLPAKAIADVTPWNDNS